MKKYSWVLVLLMAFVFAGCMDTDKPTLPSTGGGGDGIDVTFGGSDTSVKIGGGNITYSEGGYTLTYTTEWGNCISRFMLDLGAKKLTDFKKATFTWTGISGTGDNSVLKQRNIYLLATKTENNLAPWKSDEALAGLVVNTLAFDEAEPPALSAPIEGVPTTNETNTIEVELPIVKGSALTGKLWFSIYIHSQGGSYKISNFKLVEKTEAEKAETEEDKPKPPPVYPIYELPNVLEMNDGTEVTTAVQWTARRAEISQIMQNESYGQWRSGETVTYSVSGTKLTVNVSQGGKNVSFDATVEKPSVAAPEGGYPVILAFVALDGADGNGSKGNPRQHALDKGYANISVPTTPVASDNNAHTGVFYTLYPYGDTAGSQTGVLLAWAWGASKILDALEAGAATELNINANNTIITGTSRYGKAAAVAGAFEERFKITVPASSGAGGASIYRYNSKGQTYALGGYFSYNGGGSWTVDEDNPQSFNSIKGDSGGGWFNNKFKSYTKFEDLPFDQHFLFALCAGTNRHLFMVNGFEWDKWTNPPGFFCNFEYTLPVFELLGVPHNIAVSMHRYRHGLEQEDMVKLINYANYVFYGTQSLTFDYAETTKPKPATWDEFMEQLHTTPFSESVSPENNATYEERKPQL
jgi:hypothetical protein